MAGIYKKILRNSCLTLALGTMVVMPIAQSYANPGPATMDVQCQRTNASNGAQSYSEFGKSKLYQEAQGVCHTAPEVAVNVVVAEEVLAEAEKEGFFQVLLNELLFPFLTNMVKGIFLPFMQTSEERKLRMESSREDALRSEEATVEEIDEIRDAAQEDVKLQTEHLRDIDRELVRSKIRTEAFIEDGTAEEMCVLSTGRRSFSSGWGVASVSMAGMSSAFAADNNDDSPIEEIKEKLPHAMFYMGRGDYGGNIPEEVQDQVEEVYEQEVVQRAAAAGEGPVRVDGCDLRNDIDFNNFFETLNDVETPCHYEDESGAVVESNQTGVEKRMAKIAFFRNAFPNAYTQIPKEVFENNYYTPAESDMPRLSTNIQQFILDKRTVDAFRSIAQNTFIHLINRRTPTPSPEGDDEKTIFDRQMEEFGFEEDDPILETRFGQRLHEYKTDPSYEAQLEFMAKYQYFLPDYLAATTDELGKNKIVLTNATESIVLYDALQSSLRQEVLLATMLELFLDSKISDVEGLATAIVQ